MFLLKDYNAVMPVRREPAAPRYRVKHSTTEPLRSLQSVYNAKFGVHMNRLCYNWIMLKRDNFTKEL